MGATKRLIEEGLARDAWADDLLLKHEAISRCEIHEHVLMDNLDSGAVEDAADEARQTPFEGMRPNEAAEFVSERVNQIGEECGYCAKS